MPRPRSLPALLLTCVACHAGDPAQGPLNLSLQEAIKLAVANNLQAQIALDTREFSREGAVFEQGAFDWTLAGGLGVLRTRTDDTNPRISGLGNLFLGDTATDTSTRSAAVGVGKVLPWGATFSFTLTPSLTSQTVEQRNRLFTSTDITTTGYETINPYGGRYSVSFTQPLLRGFGKSATQYRLLAAKKRAEVGDLNYRTELVNLVTTTDGLYWDLVYARQNLKNKQTALELTRKQMDEDQERIKAGMLAPLELPQVEAAVAEREKQVISARGRVENTRAALLAQLFPELPQPSDLVTTDHPSARPIARPLEEAKATALANRPELQAAKSDLEAKKILESASRNHLLPQLDANLSYGGNSASRNSLGDAISDWSANRLPGYYVGVSVSVPLGNHGAKGEFGQARATRRSAELGLRSLQQAVLLDVQLAYTDLETAEQEAVAAKKALDYRQKSLEAEMDKLENGMTTSFFVLQRQDELDQAKAAEIEAEVACQKAHTNLQRAMGTLLEDREVKVQ